VLGALLQKRVRTSALPFVSGALQQLAAGLAMLLPASLFETLPHTLGARPVIAIGYLVIFGSVVGYSSFIYSLTHLPVAIVSIYTFVNPIVAVFLGWLAFREPFGYRSAIAMLIIFAGIGLVRWSEASRGRERKTIVYTT
jgi:drug/metabolite transporter (DMT)-like permease